MSLNFAALRSRLPALPRGPAILILLLLFAVSIELLRTAWISDDAEITFRVVLNFLHGYGPTFNIDERVQGYTHPLWFILITFFTWLFNNIFIVVFSLSIVCSLLVYCLLTYRVAIDYYLGMLGLCILACSKSFVDFSTSGLENPLAHVLIIFTYLAVAGGYNPILFFLSCSALYLTRPDLILLFLPVAVFIMKRHRPAACPRDPGMPINSWIPRTTPRINRGGGTVAFALLGLLPIIIWEAFSLDYYGFLFPNTAYAKLGTGISHLLLIKQGGLYLADSFSRDPLTLTMITLGVLTSFFSDSIEKKLFALGILFYLVYVVLIGGDFMSGRFLTAPLLMAVILLVSTPIFTQHKRWLLFFIMMLGFPFYNATFLSGAMYQNMYFGQSGIADERGYWFQKNGLLTQQGFNFNMPNWSPKPREIQVGCGGLGGGGLQAGPTIHLIDLCGLVEPLLARLPVSSQRNWRIGHFVRALPDHYLSSVLQRENLLTDPQLKKLYAEVRLITRGDLMDLKRWKAIVKMNFS